MTLDSPIFVLTSDVDWASDDCIAALAEHAANLDIRPTFFATHSSALLTQLGEDERAELGVHPNFAPGSTHGNDVESIVDHVFRLFPNARSSRSHQFADSTPISNALRRRGILYDSNLCLYFQDGISAMRHSSGIIRVPVFWEEDVHFSWPQSTWDLDDYYDLFLTSGIKVINVHPIHFALNTPDAAFYQSLGKRAGELSAADIELHRFDGRGTQIFCQELLERLRNDGHRFNTLSEVGEIFHEIATVGRGAEGGRTDRLTRVDHQKYWKSSEEEKQSILRDLYSKRNALDPYATSRDYNQRELEIFAVKQALDSRTPGKLADLGCGNGYTLTSMAKALDGWSFEGVDFSEPLINAAKRFAEDSEDERQSEVSFVCGDAIEYLKGISDAALDGVLTERFLLNLPSVEAQRSTIAEIHRVLRAGGVFLMCEGSMDGLIRLNRLRTQVGLEPTLPNSADNLSSLRFEDGPIENYVEELGFNIDRKLGFSFFFAVSRALHPALIKPRTPQFNAPINDLARQLQELLSLEPGVGSNVVWVLEKAGAPLPTEQANEPNINTSSRP